MGDLIPIIEGPAKIRDGKKVRSLEVWLHYPQNCSQDCLCTKLFMKVSKKLSPKLSKKCPRKLSMKLSQKLSTKLNCARNCQRNCPCPRNYPRNCPRIVHDSGKIIHIFMHEFVREIAPICNLYTKLSTNLSIKLIFIHKYI